MIFTQDKKKRKGTTINVQMLGRNETVVLHKPGRFEYQRNVFRYPHNYVSCNLH